LRLKKRIVRNNMILYHIKYFRVVKTSKSRWVRYTTSTRERKLEKIRPIGKPNIRGESNIKLYFKGTGWEFVECSHLAIDTDKKSILVNNIWNLQMT
jgi:hypothetical protein